MAVKRSSRTFPAPGSSSRQGRQIRDLPLFLAVLLQHPVISVDRENHTSTRTSRILILSGVVELIPNLFLPSTLSLGNLSFKI